TVALDIAGTATAGVDYVALPNQVVIPAWADHTDVLVNPLNSPTNLTPEIIANGLNVLMRASQQPQYARVDIIKQITDYILNSVRPQVTEHEFKEGFSVYKETDFVQNAMGKYDLEPFTGPQWKNGDVLAPYAYVKADKPVINAKFKVSPL